jgi:predicted NBD/HSP70 family sugar kinase
MNRRAGTKMKIYAGIDIGGTSIKYGLINERGEVVFGADVRTPAREGGEAVIKAAEDAARSLIAREPGVCGIGISTAGTVDPVSGTVTYANSNLPGYGGTCWGELIDRDFGLPWSVDNDVSSAAKAEAWVGAAKGLDDFFCVTVGTGIGGAAFVGGKLYRGANGRAAQIGYMNTAGGPEWYERKASASALVRLAGVKDMGAKEIFGSARAGDKRISELLEAWFDDVAQGLANVIYTMDPGVIVIGGGVSGAGSFLTDGIMRSLGNIVPEAFLAGTELRTALCGNGAGMIGAVRELVG